MDRVRHSHTIVRRAFAIGRRLALSVLLLGSVPCVVLGQSVQFRHLTSDDGLAGAWVHSIIQDRHGFKWFGTSQGLNRYDGYAMELYRYETNDPRSLPDNSILSIYEDRKGVMWVGTRGGLSRYDRERNSFTNFMLRTGPKSLENRHVRSLLEDSRGNFWVGTTEGVFLFDRTTGRATKYALPRPSSRWDHQVQFLLEDKRKHILLGTKHDGMFDLDPATGAIRQFARGRAGALAFPSNDVQSAREDEQGQLWIAAYEAGLVKLDPATGRHTTYHHTPGEAANAVAPFLALALDRKGWIWIGTEQGLEHFDPSTGQFRHFRTEPDNPQGLSSGSFSALHVDTTGTLWAGNFSGGVNILRPASAAIQRYSAVGGSMSSLSHNSVLGFAQDSSGTVWVATDGGGLNRFDLETGQFRRFTTRNSKLSSDAVLAASVDSAGKIWIGTWDGGLNKFDPVTERFTTYSRGNTNLRDKSLFAVHVDRKHRIWAGTWLSGLVRFDPKSKSFAEYHIGEPGSESQIWIIRELHDGRLMLGTLQNGLIVFDPETSEMTRYSGVAGPEGHDAYDVRALLEESPGIVWIGTATGLVRLNLVTKATTRYSVRDGLPSNMITGLALDRTGQIWVSTDQGMARFDYKHRTAWKYTTDDGLQAREFTARSYLSGRNGVLFFGGNKGFNVIRPELLQRNALKPPVVLTGFQLFNKSVAIGGEGSPLTSHITAAKSITLDHTQSVFTIEFAALDFTAPSKNQYAYRLEGFDRDWTYVGATRTATYTSLAPAKYVFRVKASNNHGVWNDVGHSIEINIKPPFWATWWFRSLVALVVVAIVAAIVRSAQSRHRHLRAMNEQLGRASERDREAQQYLEGNVLDILGAMQRFSGGDYSVALDVKSEDAIGKLRLGFNSVVADRKRAEEELRQSQKMEAVGRLAGGVAHDFNNLLTVIKGNAELGLADLDSKEAVREELEEIERAAERASSLTRQLLAFSRKQLLKPQLLSLNDMVIDIGRMLRRTVGEDISLKIVLDPTLGSVRADPGQIEQIVLNLVVNARDAMPRGGELLIETKNVSAESLRGVAEAEDIAYVAIVVTDEGSGMAPGILDRVFEPFFTTKEQGKGTGLGLSTVYGSVKQSGGFVQVESEVGKGSRFTVLLPRVSGVEDVRPATEIDVSPRGTATVLLVEDEEAVRRLASRVLIRSGYTVLTASCGQAALEVAARNVGMIDLLMTDVVMPGMSGRELAEQLMPLHPGMRLLYASGYTEDAIIRHGVSSQETAFLEKPFTPKALLRKVRQVLDATLPEVVSSGR